MRENEAKLIDQTLKQMYEQLSDIDEFMTEMKVLMAVRERLLTEMTEDIKAIDTRIDKSDAKLEKLMDKITRWEARVGGILFIGSAMWAFIVLLKEQIFGFFKGILS